VETATNRYVGSDYTYNEIGAMKTGASYVFTYDALGQPLSKKYNNDANTQEYYIYTPGDERIGVQRGTWWTWSVRDEGGKVLRQYRSSTTRPSDASLWIEDFVWRDGLLLGSQRVPELGGRRHYHLDHLGTPRLVTADNGQCISAHDYFPFGDEYTPVWQEVAAGYDREDPMKFTGHERDYAGGMGGEDGHAIDDMHARYDSPSLGRFLSVDPIEGNSGDPQSWNRYAYVGNNPINLNDPFGLAPAAAGAAPGNVDCPPGTEGITCFTTTAPDPGPQLPPDYLKRQNFFWEDHPLSSLAGIRNPLTGLTVREHWRASGEGAAAFVDGVIPFGDPLSDLYDDGSVAGTAVSKEIGVLTRDIEIALATSGSESIFGQGRLLNTGKYLRIGRSTKLIKGAPNEVWFSVRGQLVKRITGSAAKEPHLNLWIIRFFN
jgi:RHS repeat-associated protein